jgi:hypothetical protein
LAFSIFLIGANFRDAQCQGAIFSDAQCQGAIFSDAQCQGAYTPKGVYSQELSSRIGEDTGLNVFNRFNHVVFYLIALIFSSLS